MGAAIRQAPSCGRSAPAAGFGKIGHLFVVWIEGDAMRNQHGSRARGCDGFLDAIKNFSGFYANGNHTVAPKKL
jgi:hypothetical protein